MPYVEVPSEALRAMLSEAGFSLVEEASRSEEVYERRHHRAPLYAIRVYSSIPRDRSKVRGCGQDAIRVVVLLITDRKTYPIAKLTRVFRSSSAQGDEGVKQIVERLRDRMREGYRIVNERLKAQALKSQNPQNPQNPQNQERDTSHEHKEARTGADLGR